jgi:hypothetical protein
LLLLLIRLEWSRQGEQREQWREELEVTESQIRDLRAQILAKSR